MTCATDFASAGHCTPFHLAVTPAGLTNCPTNIHHISAMIRLPWNQRKTLLLAILLFSIAGAYLVRSSCGVDSLLWCNIYAVQDFDTFDKTADFVKNLRVPIPVLLSLAEIGSFNLFGDTYLVTRTCYRIAMVLSFVVAIYLASSNSRKMLASVLFSFVFLWATVLIHPGNAQTYDIFLPLFSLLFIVCLKIGIKRPDSAGPTKLTALCFTASGFFLSMAELMRPFVLFVLPLMLFGAYLALRNRPKRYFLCFLAPLILFSGTWHLNMALRHGQIAWSQHSGFNLSRAWPMVPRPMLIRETHNQPLQPFRWANKNTQEHFENSRRLQENVVQYVLTHPYDSMGHLYDQMGALLFGKTQLFNHKPESPLIWVYRPMVWIASLWLFYHATMLVIGLCHGHGYLFGVPENLLIVMTLSYIFIFAFGESGEQARFLLSLLPLLAAFPSVPMPQLSCSGASQSVSLPTILQGNGSKGHENPA